MLLAKANIRTDIDWRLLLASLASLILRSKRCPIEGSHQASVSKLANFDFPFGRLLSLELGKAMETGCGRRTGEKKCLKKHSEDY